MRYSILLPVYKSDKLEYLKLSINSMLNQTMPSDDFVIVEDGPVPRSIEEYLADCSANNPSVKILCLPNNVGLGLALNEGLKVCKNELVARMDADDISLPTRCQKQLEMFEKYPDLDIVGCPVKEFIDTTDNIIGKRDVPLSNEEIHRYNRRRDPFNHPTVMYRKSKVMLFGPYGNYRKNQDTDLWLKMLSNGCKGANLPEYLLLFRFDENTYKKRKSWINTKNLISIRYRAFKQGWICFTDFAVVAVVQLGMYVLPASVQKFLYKKVLHK